MARIPTYQKDIYISDLDRIIGTDGDTNELVTKNFFLGDIAEYVIDKFIDPDAVSFQIPLFRDTQNTLGSNATRITGSIMTQDTYPDGSLITVSGQLQVSKEAKIRGRLVGGVAESGQLVLNSSLNATSITIKAPSHANLPFSYTWELPSVEGSPGDQLTTNGAGKLYWAQPEDDNLTVAGDGGQGTIDLDTQILNIVGGANISTTMLGQTLTINASGFVTGSGTQSTLPMWGATGQDLVDSFVSQGGSTVYIDSNVALGASSANTITTIGKLYLNSPVKDTTNTQGDENQILVSDAAGELTFTDLSDIATGSAEVIEVPVKNLQGSALTKGDPVYISGSVGTSGRLEVQLADASNAAKMPAVGLLKQDLGVNEEGFVVVTGKLRNLDNSTIDGQPPSYNDVIYVKASGTTGNALTLVKPVGSALIQNMGKVGRVSNVGSNDGTFVVSSILRTNDIPNLTPGKIWVGSTGNTIESATVHLNEALGRMGIGTTSPKVKLEVAGKAIIGTGNSIGTNTDITIIGDSNDAANNTIIDNYTNVVLGDSTAGRFSNTAITDRTLRLGRADDIGPTAFNTTGILNFNNSVLANTAYSNIGGIIGYFPPPTTSNNYYFFNALDENVDTNVFQPGASPTASRFSMSTAPSLSCILQNFDANTTNSGAMYVVASNNSSTPSSRGIVTFDVRHQNQNANVPDGHSLFEVTSGYGQSKFLIKQVSGSTNVGIGTTSPNYKLDVDDTIGVGNSLIVNHVPGTFPRVFPPAVPGGFFETEPTGRVGVVNNQDSGEWAFSAVSIADGVNFTNRSGLLHSNTNAYRFILSNTTEENIRLNSEGNSFIKGRLAIGHDTPIEALDVDGIVKVSNRVKTNQISVNGGSEIKLNQAIFYNTGNITNIVGPDIGATLHLRTNEPLVAQSVIALTRGGQGTDFPSGITQNASGDYTFLLRDPNNNQRIRLIANDLSSGDSIIDSRRIVLCGNAFDQNGSISIDGKKWSSGVRNALIEFNKTGTQTDNALEFRVGGNLRGSINYSDAGTSYNVASDYRLKENVVEITDGIERLKQLKPSKFNFISNTEKVVDGFIAHEVQEVIPEAVTGVKDATEEYEVTPAEYDDYGNLVSEAVMGTRDAYQQIDQAKIVPLLTAALQEAVSKIEALEARIQILENQ